MKDGKSFDILDMIEAAAFLGITKDTIIEHIRDEMYKSMKKEGIPQTIFTNKKYLTYAMRAAVEGLDKETDEPEKKHIERSKPKTRKLKK